MKYIYADQDHGQVLVPMAEGDFLLHFTVKERLSVERVLLALSTCYDDIAITRLYNMVRISHDKKEEH